MMETMRKFALWCCSLCLTGVLYAQGNDPVVMKINGKDVPRSEFEYNFNKNNGENVVDKKTVDEYVDLFVNYKWKLHWMPVMIRFLLSRKSSGLIVTNRYVLTSCRCRQKKKS